jgi:hypothetical protein
VIPDQASLGTNAWNLTAAGRFFSQMIPLGSLEVSALLLPFTSAAWRQ